MTTEEIKNRLFSLQEEINTLVTLLPEDADVSFGTLYHTKPTNESKRKRLVVAIKNKPGPSPRD